MRPRQELEESRGVLKGGVGVMVGGVSVTFTHQPLNVTRGETQQSASFANAAPPSTAATVRTYQRPRHTHTRTHTDSNHGLTRPAGVKG